MVTLLLGAILAALMSTADSALLTLSSIFAKDIYGKYIRPTASDAGCARVGQWCAWLILGGLVWLSTQENLTLYRLFVLKFEILLQIAPAFYFGVNFPSLRTTPIMLGLVTGLCVAVSGWSLGWMPFGLHPGTVGLLCNVLMIMSAHSFYAIKPSGTQSSN